MVYEPAEDTYFFRDFLKDLDLEDKKALEIGTGNGLLAVTMAEKGANVTASDIDRDAIQAAEERAEKRKVSDRISFVHSDMFEDIEGKFDIIIFNPPYLPGDYSEKTKDWAGGEKGIEKTLEFVEGAKRHVKLRGDIYFIASSRADLSRLEQFSLDKVASKELWFEELVLYRL